MIRCCPTRWNNSAIIRWPRWSSPTQPQRALRGGSDLVGGGMSCSTSTLSITSGFRLERRQAPAYRLNRRSTLLRPIVVDTDHLASMMTPRGQPLTQMVTTNDAMPFHMFISRDAKVSLMSLQVFSTLKIPILSLTLASPIRGPNGDLMKTHGSIVLPIVLGAADDFQTFLVNFFIVDPMFPYEAILTWGRGGECRGNVPQVPWAANYGPKLWIRLVPSSGK
jgi:hypothetical protein